FAAGQAIGRHDPPLEHARERHVGAEDAIGATETQTAAMRTFAARTWSECLFLDEEWILAFDDLDRRVPDIGHWHAYGRGPVLPSHRALAAAVPLVEHGPAPIARAGAEDKEARRGRAAGRNLVRQRRCERLEDRVHHALRGLVVAPDHGAVGIAVEYGS